MKAEFLATVRARIQSVGWSETARRSGINRVTLHRCFGERARNDPGLETIVAVLPHVGLELAATESPQCSQL